MGCIASGIQEVRGARAEESDYVHKMGLYEKVPVEECVGMIGKRPTSTRWIDISKGVRPTQIIDRDLSRERSTTTSVRIFVQQPPPHFFGS